MQAMEVNYYFPAVLPTFSSKPKCNTREKIKKSYNILVLNISTNIRVYNSQKLLRFWATTKKANKILPAMHTVGIKHTCICKQKVL